MVHSFSGHIVHVPKSALQLAKCAAALHTHTHTHGLSHCHWQASSGKHGIASGGGETICPPPMAVRLAADLRPSADGSAVRTSPVAGQLQAASVPIA